MLSGKMKFTLGLKLKRTRQSASRNALILLLQLLLISQAGFSQATSQQRIADAWFAHNSVVVMLGGADRIVATVVKPSAFPWMYRVAPALSNAVSIDGTTMNAEELRRLNTNLVFTSKSDPTATALQRAGLNVVPVGFEDYSSLLRCVDQTATVLGTPFALKQAKLYRDYVTTTLSDIQRTTSQIPLAQRPRVLHILSLDPLVVDGANTIIDEWIKAAGGRNAAEGIRGVKKEVSIEQLLVWQPDVLILGAKAGSIETAKQRDLLTTLTAYKNHRVYRNPAGVFPWDRYGPEVALELSWASSVLHMHSPVDQDLIQKTQSFYKTFFSYPLTDDDARQILSGLPPVTNINPSH